MRAVIQRVGRAGVTVEGNVVGRIDRGLLVLVGVAHGDTDETARALAGKIARLRIFQDEAGKMNLSVRDAGGGVLAVSQFTLLADTRKGNRPSFIGAAPPEEANRLYEVFCDAVAAEGLPVERGVFGAMMDVELVNQGPVTIVMEM
ncbi:MAG: D-tyrosyl-tRNA(Tyr) deacylase [Planctomycetes bacterium]|nr:D-tyrosyl-tRNA(Tyr) deacylase [Planctomycetota bacterium]